ncbi:MAG: nucleoside kinase, partial [Schwartzia sp.]|nr:nucleoside kinase [Schwartzia sp. (in: firmicutes)]
PEQPIIVEGIHGLNEELTHAVPRDEKFKIYVSALTQLNIDMHNRIPTTDARFVRRLVRDYKFRASSALKTLRQWPDVRKGEDKNIFPYQEDADAVFNSALIYELAVLRKYALPLLQAVRPEETGHAAAQEILRFLSLFGDIEDESDVPNNSILREFIGKSCFFADNGELKE